MRRLPHVQAVSLDRPSLTLRSLGFSINFISKTTELAL